MLGKMSHPLRFMWCLPLLLHEFEHAVAVVLVVATLLESLSMAGSLSMASCAGITRAGKKCQITHTSSMLDSNGRLVAGPLRRGSPYCLLHAKPFMHYPAVPTGPIVLLLLDLETTGTDVGRCRIVERRFSFYSLLDSFLDSLFTLFFFSFYSLVTLFLFSFRFLFRLSFRLFFTLF